MSGYLNIDCINCGRHRVEETYICEKCGYDNKNMKYVAGGGTMQEVDTVIQNNKIYKTIRILNVIENEYIISGR